MKKILICCFISILITKRIYSQSDFCGTIFTQAEIDQIAQLAQARAIFTQDFIQQKNSNAVQPIQSVPVQIHIVRQSNGNGGVPSSEIKTGLAVANNYYINANIQFVVCSPVNYIDNDTYYDLNPNTEEFTLASANDVPNVINIYFVNSFETVGWGGYYRPGTDRLFMRHKALGSRDNLVTEGLVLSHELGHYFSLFHTCGITTGTTNELVIRFYDVLKPNPNPNCQTAGDGLCDTPADPNESGIILNNGNETCTYPFGLGPTPCGTPFFFCDANGDQYQPLNNNIMFAYKVNGCFNQFTTEQYARIVYDLISKRFYLKPADFDLVLNDNPYNGDILYKAHNTITAQQNFKADANDRVILLAGNEIILKDGFIAEQGTDLIVRIQDFGSYCSPIALKLPMLEENQNPSDQNIQPNQELGNSNYFSIAPNPSSTGTTIQYSVESEQPVSIVLYNVFGKQAMELVSVKEHPAGNFAIRLDASYLPAGIYFCNIRNGDYVETRKFILLKPN